MYKTAAVLVLALATTMAWAQSSQDNYQTNQAGAQKITNGPVIEYTSDHSAMIAWSTKLPAGTYIAYGTDRNNLNQRTEKAWGGTNHRLEIKNLQPSTTYYFQVRSENAAGQGAQGSDVESPVDSFTTVAKGAAPDRTNRDVGVNGTNSSAASYSTGSLQITKAWYGVGNQSKDVTSIVSSHVQNDQVNLPVNSSTFGGDPAAGQSNTLTVQYTVNGQSKQAQASEGSTLTLPQ